MTGPGSYHTLTPLPFHHTSRPSHLVDDPAVAKISVKFPWGKAVVRRFRQSDLVQSLYAFAQQMASTEAAGSKGSNSGFDLFTAFPSTSLGGEMYTTLGAAGLAGSQVIMRWT